MAEKEIKRTVTSNPDAPCNGILAGVSTKTKSLFERTSSGRTEVVR